MSKTKTSINGNSRKRGETARKILHILENSPTISISKLAKILGISYEAVRSAIKKIRENPGRYAAIFGLSEDTVLSISVRAAANSERNVCSSSSAGKKWRGRGDWPAHQVASKRNVRIEEAVRWCASSYQQDGGRYTLDEGRVGRRPSDMPKYFRKQV